MFPVASDAGSWHGKISFSYYPPCAVLFLLQTLSCFRRGRRLLLRTGLVENPLRRLRKNDDGDDRQKSTLGLRRKGAPWIVEPLT